MTTRPLHRAELKFLRSLAHALKPVVRLGQNGLTDAVTRELDGALERHELVKVKLAGDSREARDAQLDALASSAGALVVQRIGHTATLYRENAERPRIDLAAARG